MKKEAIQMKMMLLNNMVISLHKKIIIPVLFSYTLSLCSHRKLDYFNFAIFQTTIPV
jgi:hypothetical protein